MTDPHSHRNRLESALAGRYKIERKLGEGGMATVYLAEDVKHGRKVAIKILRPELAADSGEADSFLYYVMPFVAGETLRSGSSVSSNSASTRRVRIACGVAEALDYAHRNHVIHRDIKPANILLHDGNPVVADFGIALAVSAAGGGRMTETGLSLGTPHYMSPEQASAERDLSARSDIYSLGCVLYEMLAGQPPHPLQRLSSPAAHSRPNDPRAFEFPIHYGCRGRMARAKCRSRSWPIPAIPASPRPTTMSSSASRWRSPILQPPWAGGTALDWPRVDRPSARSRSSATSTRPGPMSRSA